MDNTRVAPPSSNRNQLRHFDPHLIERLVEAVGDELVESGIWDMLDEAFAEQFDLEEREAVGSIGMVSWQSALLARALLRVSENYFLQATGAVDDTP